MSGRRAGEVVVGCAGEHEELFFVGSVVGEGVGGVLVLVVRGWRGRRRERELVGAIDVDARCAERRFIAVDMVVVVVIGCD
jgi:hypothetical protein